MSRAENYDLICIGGGAAGFFTAIRYSELQPDARILIVEKSNKVLSKVRISGGGRCNVTHACFDPREMVAHYPRGAKEMLGPFHHFLCGDMMAWLSENGVETKVEKDGRVFPTTDSSQTIIDLFQERCSKAMIEVKTGEAMTAIDPVDGHWKLTTLKDTYQGSKLMLATGSTPSVWKILEKMGYGIVPPVPSLFTFNIDHPLLKELQGLSMPDVSVSILENESGRASMSDSGPLLITHWGVSGPAVLKLSSKGARLLAQRDHRFDIELNWIAMDSGDVVALLSDKRETEGRSRVAANPLFHIPKRLWKRMCEYAGVGNDRHGDLNRAQRHRLAETLCKCTMKVEGKSTYKDEFVTCGGVERKQIDFKTMQSRLHQGLYLAGEVIDIDAVTGGFNFQAAWTEGWIAAGAMARLKK